MQKQICKAKCETKKERICKEKGPPHQLKVLLVGDNRLAKVNGSVNDRLLLLTLQDARYDGLGSDTVPTVVNDDRAQGVEPLHVHRAVHADAHQVTALESDVNSCWSSSTQ